MSEILLVNVWVSFIKGQCNCLSAELAVWESRGRVGVKKESVLNSSF